MIKDASDSRWTSKGASGSDTELNSADKDASHLRWTSTGASVIDTKLNSSDVVTQTDRNVEVFCIAAIKKAYPGHAFIGEESYAAGKKAQLSSEPTWCVSLNCVAQADMRLPKMYRAG